MRALPSVQVVVALALLTGLPASLAQAPPPSPSPHVPEQAPFEGEARVTAIGLAVQVRNALGTVSGGLDPADFTVRGAEEALDVVSVAPVGTENAAEPWRIAVWIDPLLSGPRGLLAGAATLARHAKELAALGTVEVFVADPAARLVLPATREVELIDDALSRVALEIPGEDRLSVRRRSLASPAEAPSSTDPDETPAAGALAAVAEEAELVLRSLDELLAWVDAEAGRGPRALFLIHGGFDLDPAAFWTAADRGAGAGIPDGPEIAAAWSAAVGRAAGDIAAAVAGYGWLVLPLGFDVLEPPSENNVSAFDRQRYWALDGPAGDSMSMITVRKSFGGKKKTADEEPPPVLADPAAPLRALAAASSGSLIARPREVADALRLLDRRVLVTAQAAWPLDGELRPLTVTAREGELEVSAPAWVRSGAPVAVAEARARRIVAGDAIAGALLLKLEPLAGGERLWVRVPLSGSEAPDPAPEPGGVRLTIAHGAEGRPPVFRHELVDQRLIGESWQLEIAPQAEPASEWLLVMVENLADGQWGAQALELGPPSEPERPGVQGFDAPTDDSRPPLRICGGDSLTGDATGIPEVGTPPALLVSLLDVLATGDQAAYERFVQKNYAPAALAEYPAEEHASSLARIYADTGGFSGPECVVGETPEWVQAEARDRTVGGRYCLTLTHSQESGRAWITDFAARGLYPAGPNLTTPLPTEVARTIETLANEYAARDLFSGVILIAKEDMIILERAYGMASLAYGAPMTLATRLNIASIGKSLTGVAIAQLVDAGKLSYDDLVGKVLPDYPDRDVRERVTVRQLLSHTSGLGPKDYYEGPLWATRSRLRSVADYMKLVAGTPLGGEPGTYHYSNSGYVILGAIIERLTGSSYYDYVREHIFKSAGMTRSFYHEMDMEDSDVAVPLTNLFNNGEEDYIYRLGPPRNATYELAARGGPQGGAFVTARDLFAFQRALRNGTLVSSSRFEEMTTAQSPSGAGAPGLMGDAREGLGVEVITRNGHTFFGHSGGDLGIASLVYWYPDSGYTTIILSNRDPRAARVMANASRALITRRTISGAVPPAQECVPPASD